MTIVYTRNRTLIAYGDLALGTPGNEGTVFPVVNNQVYEEHCVKIYNSGKNTTEQERKIEFMTKNMPANGKSENFILCWPVEAVVDIQGRFCGFLMPKGFASSEQLYKLVTSDSALSSTGEKWKKFDRTVLKGFEYRLKICVNIAIAVHAIHEMKKYVMVDYKPQNILINEFGKISVVDVDSFQIGQGNDVLFPAGGMTDHYMPPESEYLNPAHNFITPLWDRFSMAVSFYQLLFGIHPYAATPGGKYAGNNGLCERIRAGLFVHGWKKKDLVTVPALHDNFHRLPHELQKLFLNAFDEPTKRPSPEDWGKAINRALTSGKIQPNVALSAQPSSRSAAPTSGRIPHNTAAPKPPSAPPKPGVIQQPPIVKIKTAKKTYMPYKIASVLLLLALLWMYRKWTNANDQLEELRLQASHDSISMVHQERVRWKGEETKKQLAESELRVENQEKMLNTMGAQYPITIARISFVNTLYEQEIAELSTTGENVFAADSLHYLVPVLKYNSNITTATTLAIFLDIIDPDGQLLQNNLSPDEHSFSITIDVPGDFTLDNTVAMNAFQLTEFTDAPIKRGKYTVNIWCNKILAKQAVFHVTRMPEVIE